MTTTSPSTGDRPGFEPRHPNAVPARCDGCPAPARWTRGGSRYCDEHAVLTTPMFRTSPASMGGPLSEAEREYRERVEFMSRLGFGDDKTERAARLSEIVDNVEEAFAAAHDHYECPFYCNHCGERLADKDCEECHGAGGHVVQGAYSECSNCGGDMRIHEGCAEKSYADLVAERDAARARVGVLEGQLATAQEQLAHFAAQHQPHNNMYRTCRTCKDGYGEPRPWPCEDALRLGLVGNCPECAGPTLRGVDRECPKCDAKLSTRALGLDGGDPDER